MGISGTQFWNTSANGKAMVIFLSRRNDVELVREICEWLVVERQKTLFTQAKQRGANEDQAKIVARDGVAKLDALAASINDRNVEGNATEIVDTVFKDHFVAGTEAYAKVMNWLAGTLRQRVKNGPNEFD